jgi:purine-binding chemotaxis protein CheW
MEQAVATTGSRVMEIVPGDDREDYVTFIIKDQSFGVPVLKVQDILTPDKIANIPMSPPEVKGSINLRGRIVTVIDVRVRLGLEKRDPSESSMGVTVEHENDLYTLLVDSVGDVIGLSSEGYDGNPSTLDPLWREFALGIYRLEDKLMVILDIEKLLNLKQV